ncbi:MAG: T9SS type A sorting domain-containing protein [Bacteroidota bacterium]
MKNKITIFLFAFLFASQFLQAQITLKTSDMPVAGTVINFSYPDSFDVSILGLGNANANQNWNLSNLTVPPGSQPTLYVNPSSTPQGNQFPNASLSSASELTDSSDYSYFLSNSNEFSQLGQAGVGSLLTFSQPFKMFKFPFGAGTVIDQSTNLSGNSDGYTISGTAKTNVSVVGSGTVKTPLGTFPCIRVKRITELNVNILVFNVIERDTVWEWWTNSHKAPVFSYHHIYTSSFGDETTDAYSEILSGEAVATHNLNAPSVDLQISPNPTSGPINVTFTALNNGKTTLQVVDATGALVYTAAPDAITTGDQQISLDLQDKPAGIYFICLRQAGKLIAIKQVVKN